MRYERLSKQEQMLFEVFQEVNAMTYEQVKQFLMSLPGQRKRSKIHCTQSDSARSNISDTRRRRGDLALRQ